MIRIPQQKKKFKAQGILLESESQFRTGSVVGTDGPVNYSGSYTSGSRISAERKLKKQT